MYQYLWPPRTWFCHVYHLNCKGCGGAGVYQYLGPALTSLGHSLSGLVCDSGPGQDSKTTRRKCRKFFRSISKLDDVPSSSGAKPQPPVFHSVQLPCWWKCFCKVRLSPKSKEIDRKIFIWLLRGTEHSSYCWVTTLQTWVLLLPGGLFLPETSSWENRPLPLHSSALPCPLACTICRHGWYSSQV